MRCLKPFLAVLMAIGMVPSDPQCMVAAEHSSPRSGTMRDKATQLGSGADVSVTLTAGDKVSGVIESLSDSSMSLRSGVPAASRLIPYSNITHLQFARTKYTARGKVDPVEVRRVAIELGERRPVSTRTVDGRRLKGRLGAMEAEQLTLRRGGEESLSIADSQVEELKGRTSGRALSITLAAVGGTAIVVLTVLLTAIHNS